MAICSALSRALCCVALALLAVGFEPAAADDEPLARISFGSCNNQDLDQGIWDAIRRGRPDVWFWLGDNIYADKKIRELPTKIFERASISEMAEMYERQKAVPGYAALMREVKHMVATWDDHDYGLDDAGKELPGKEASQELFLDFIGVPRGSSRRARKGVYHSETYGPPGKRVKLIILDLRYHRDPIGEDGDMLGREQWQWLEGELASSDAEFTLVGSSIQFIADHHPLLSPVSLMDQSPIAVESWSHFPQSRRRFLALVERTRTAGVVLLSGDVHFGEIQKSPAGCLLPYDLYDFTSSGLTHSAEDLFPNWLLELVHSITPKANSVGTFFGLNFGTLDFDWDGPGGASMTFAVRNKQGREQIGHKVFAKDLQFGTAQKGPTGVCSVEREMSWPSRNRIFLVVIPSLLLAFGGGMFLACKVALISTRFLLAALGFPLASNPAKQD